MILINETIECEIPGNHVDQCLTYEFEKRVSSNGYIYTDYTPTRNKKRTSKVGAISKAQKAQSF